MKTHRIGVMIGTLLLGAVAVSAQLTNTNVNNIGMARFASGATNAPSMAFAANPFDGFYWVSDGVFGPTNNGNARILWSSKMLTSSTYTYCFAPTTDVGASQASNTSDTGWGRLSAGIITVIACDVAGGGSIRANFHNSTAISALTVTTNTIAPTGSLHSLGAGLIKTITVPAQCTPTCFFNVVPTAAYTYDATGNINVPVGGGTALISKVMTFVWDGTKWSPSY